MNFTYRNNLWKGEATNIKYPSNSRPALRSDTTENKNITSKFGTARPLNHWRKQLEPAYNTVSSKMVTIDTINAPNSAVYVGDSPCYDNYKNLKIDIRHESVCDGIKDGNTCKGGTNHIRRSANTNLNKKYYQSSSQYLKAKCKTFEQKQSIGQKVGTNTYQSSKYSDLSCNYIIFKPNNASYNRQGSVTSSNRTLKLKYDTITKNGASFQSAYGAAGMNAGKYKNSYKGAPFFQKSKESSCNSC